MWCIRALMVALVIVLPSIPAMAQFTKPRIQSATPVALQDRSNAAAMSPSATTTETANGTTTYFGKASEPAAEAAKPQPLPPPTLTASIDLSRQMMTVSINGEARYSWPISSGTSRYPTPTGTFHPEWTAKMWYSRKYDWAPMPSAVFINGGVAVHGTSHVGALGRPASHGCIRLAPGNARTFYNLVQRHGLKMTRVSVHGRPNWSGEAIASRNSPRKKVYASSQENWFWGGPWAGSQDTTYVPNVTKKKRGEYADKRPSRRKYSNASGYGNNY